MFKLAGIPVCLALIWAAVALNFLGIRSVSAQSPDATPPQLALPGSITVEAISRQGVTVTYSATARDVSDPKPALHCNPASGMAFPLGTTTVVCTATDAAGNSSSGSFPVTVRDITPPSLNLPVSLKTEASSRLGALVIYANSASDSVDPGPVVVCEPPSGSVFSLGATTVSCTGIDTSGNVAGEHFVVTVEDTSMPTILGRVSPSPNSNGWNNTDVAVTFTCSDTASGIVTCEGDSTLAGEGDRRSVGGIAVDSAGNIATATLTAINIDKTPPLVIIQSPAQGAEFWLSEPVLTNWEVRDFLSGVDKSTGTAQPGLAVDTSSLGPHEFSVTATDRAGNSTRASHTYTVVSSFADFVIHDAEVGIEGGSPRDEFLVEGTFKTGGFSNGIKMPEETITVTFDGFTQTIPAGTFIREANDLGFQFDGASGGITRFIVRGDGQFLVKAKMIKLPGVGLNSPIRFSLRIGDDVGHTDILLQDEGPFRLETRRTRDFFGNVMSAGDGVLTVKTNAGIVSVSVTAATNIRLPHKPGAELLDLIAGDLVAVSLEEQDEEFFADKIFRVPAKTRNKHVPGEVVAITDTHITVAPTVPDAAPVIFRLGQNTPVRFHRGETEIGVGAFVIIGAVRDPHTGLLSAEAREINVIPGKESTGKEVDRNLAVGLNSPNEAKIVGVLEGIDKGGNWIVNGVPIAIGALTLIDEGLAVGQTIQVHAELIPGGSLLARRAGKSAKVLEVGGETKLEGIFEGIDEMTGDWIISGLPINVGVTADTDGFPSLGQPIKVLARLGDDGTFLVREIENRLDSDYSQTGNAQLKLQGVFSGVDSQGNWEINGIKFAVDRFTRLEGSPARDRTIEVQAIRREDGSLLARSIEGETLVEPLSGNRAELSGIIEEVLANGSLVIQGVSITRGILTESDVDFQAGDFVEAEILVQKGGLHLATRVQLNDGSALRDFPGSSPVDIQGILDQVNSDDTLIVNGITVAVGPLSQVKGSLIPGAGVSLEGLFAADGSIVARELRIRGRRGSLDGVEASIQGLVEEIGRDPSGNLVAIVVNGVAINIEILTQIKGGLDAGARVLVRAIIVNGTLVARVIEGLDASIDLSEGGQFVIKGSIDRVEFDDQGQSEVLELNGRDILISSETFRSEVTVVGNAVKVQGVINEGVLLAEKIEAEPDLTGKQGRIEFNVQGAVSSIINDENGNPAEFVVDGTRLSLQMLTLLDGILERGIVVQVAGIVHEDQLLASKIKKIEGLPYRSASNIP